MSATAPRPERFEVELKFRNVEHSRVRARLLEMGAQPLGTRQEADIYLAHPARDFALTGEVFRIRRAGREVELTYKGPKQPGPAKTREEIEIPCGAGDLAAQNVETLCARLGFRLVRTVTKSREMFAFSLENRALTVTLDTVAELGAFAEVETLAFSDADLAAAQAAVVELARLLELHEIEPKSYLRLLLASDLGS